MSTEFEKIASLVLHDAPAEQLEEFLLEGEWKEEIRQDQRFYEMMFEQYLDMCSVYAFEGWDEAHFSGAPHIEKYFVVFDIKLPHNANLSSLRRINGRENEHSHSIKETDDDSYLIRFRILRSFLEKLEEDNRIAARKKAENYGYISKEEAIDKQETGTDPGMTDGF